MQQVRVSRHLHDVFGETPTLFEILAVLAFGLAMPVVLVLTDPAMVQSVSLWRSALALVLILDIAAGCAANFTRSTNDFYAVRPRNRRIFIAAHVHLLLVAWLLGADPEMSVAVWAYTIAGASIVNRLSAHPLQSFVGGLLLIIGLCGIALWDDQPDFMRVVAQLFLIKVLFAFAVDHYRGARNT